MRIGVFFESMPQEDGGGFTFQETVLRSMAMIAGMHEFVIFHYGPTPLIGHSSSVKFQSLGRTNSGKIKRAFCKMLAPVRKAQFKKNRFLGMSQKLIALSPLDAASRDAAIDILWFPTPLSEPVGCPFIATVWDLEHRAQPFFPEVSSNGEWGRREDHYRSLLPRASYVITGTEVGKREIEQFYGVAGERIRLLKHPTPAFATEKYNEFFCRPKHLPLGDYLFYPAQFWAHKNHVCLVRAVALLKERGEEIRVAFVGADKGNRAHVEKEAARLNVTDLVHFLGFVTREELLYLYQHALALAYPSLCGPENLPPLEAFALGCPVMAADIPGSREQLGSFARLLPGLEPTKWADAAAEWKKDAISRAMLPDIAMARAFEYTGKHFITDLGDIFTEYAKIRNLWD
jgi:glycosyltransferase involved in cell wall biosynthesis